MELVLFALTFTQGDFPYHVFHDFDDELTVSFSPVEALQMKFEEAFL